MNPHPSVVSGVVIGGTVAGFLDGKHNVKEPGFHIGLGMVVCGAVSYALPLIVPAAAISYVGWKVGGRFTSTETAEPVDSAGTTLWLGWTYRHK